MEESTNNYLKWFQASLDDANNYLNNNNQDFKVGTDPLYQYSNNSFTSLFNKGVKGGLEGVKGFKAVANTTNTVNSANALKSSLDTASKIAGGSATTGSGAFLKGATTGLEGLSGVGNLAVSAANFIPGVQSDYNDTFGKVLNIGSTGVGMASALGVAGLGPIGFGLGTAVLINNLAGKRANKLNIGKDSLINTGTGYSGIQSDVATAGKKTTLTGNLFGYKGKRTGYINKKVSDLETKRAIASTVGNENKLNILGATNTMQDIANKNKQALFGGLNTKVLSAKNGAKLNVIPSGALHARKHNLPKEISEHVTNKGIPVISHDEKGGIIQHAEIESSEIIFHKELTDKLENLFKSYENGNKDSLIEAGKLVAYEILENTIDNTGIINGN